MRRGFLLWLVLGVLVCAATTTRAAEVEQKRVTTAPSAVTRSLNVLSPRDGETIMGTTVVVRIETENLTILPAPVPADAQNVGKHPELNREGDGHLHLKLDVMPVIVWDDNVATYTLANVPPGEHELEINFSHNDHRSYQPQLAQTIRFRTVLPLPATGNTQQTLDGNSAGSLVVVALLLACFGVAIRRPEPMLRVARTIARTRDLRRVVLNRSLVQRFHRHR